MHTNCDLLYQPTVAMLIPVLSGCQDPYNQLPQLAICHGTSKTIHSSPTMTNKD